MRGPAVGSCVAFVLSALLVPSTAWGAATIDVNITTDVLSPSDGKCSLREATVAANTDTASGAATGECVAGSGLDTIRLPAGRYTLSIAPVGPDDATSGDLNLTSDAAMRGAGARTTIIDANQIDRVITVGTFISDVTAAIERVTITGGRTLDGSPGLDGGGGGGILNRGDLTVTESVIAGNATGNGGDAVCMNCNAGSAGSGGGIQNIGRSQQMQRHGSLTLRETTISANSTGDGGDSEGPAGFAGAGGEGGGLETLAPLSVVNATIVGNRTGSSGTAANVIPNSDGGGVLTAGASTFTNVTIAGNQTGRAGVAGGISHVNGTLTLTSTLVASNSAPNCSGTVGDGGGNLAYPPATSDCPAGFNPGNPLLGALGDHGGATPTVVPSAGSAAANAASGAACPDTDQRGIARPIGTGCDIGAVERAVPVATTGAASGISETFATLAGSVDNPGLAGSARIQYGTTTAYGSESASHPIGAATSGVPVIAVVAPLAPGTTYHFRLIATGTDGTSVGADATFRTAPRPTSPSPPPRCAGRVATIVATPGVPTRGTARADVIVGTSGADRIDGGGGNDRICARGGKDRVGGGSGADRINGESGADRISGGSGGDRINGGSGADSVNGGSGTDLVAGGSGSDVVSGGGGARDRISGGSGDDRVRTRDAVRDSVNCGGGNDQAAADDVDRVRRCERLRRR
jgi:CSLREA domain-containing protein